MDRRLNVATLAGDIDALYALIRDNPRVLESVEDVPFIDTPLHIAAARGDIDFAMEIMNLKPSFTTKLNPDGFSPMHLAVQNDQSLMVLWLLDVDKDLVRIKGRGGFTPLHCAAARGDSAILAEFFSVCPESIKDVTNQGNTALHIAAENDSIEALMVLMGWLKRSFFEEARLWEREIVNWKNKHGNTLLHIVSLKRQYEVVKKLKQMFDHIQTNIKNSEGLTAIDILQSQAEFKSTGTVMHQKTLYQSILHNAGIVRRDIILVNYLTSMSSFRVSYLLSLFREINQPLSQTESILLVVHALVATITYQAALSPPGGVRQGSADIDSNIQSFFRVSAATNETLSRHVGTTVMSNGTFTVFWLINTFIFLRSIVKLFRRGFLPVPFTVVILFASYTFTMSVVSPTSFWSNFNLALFLSLPLVFICGNLHRLYVTATYSMVPTRKRRYRLMMNKRKEWW